MTRLIDADTPIHVQIYDDMTEEWSLKETTVATALDYWADEGCPPTVEPTLYGYKVEHLALIARVMQEDGVTPEQAVQTFKDVQTLVLKLIDEIEGAVKRAFEQAMETAYGEDNEQTDKR